ncbi:unnamed protein product [Allacma fusca]|uniref:Lipase domain-containing protein n=1 Tax=Allacma fusca TaxID=39272 RepID=A0A8J2P820_9HEXA|nr:unnamed protein product [Allacma fusca]
MARAYVQTRYPTNVVMVDFGPLAQSGLPLLASPLSILTAFFSLFNARRISERVADMIIFLMRCQMLQGPKQVHLIGFSLSGALVGFVGKFIQQKTLRKIGRISGLDSIPYLALLDKSDADFVDMTHTRFGIIPPFIPPIVHAQFYINRGGPHQPNCPNLWPFVETYCSHSTANFYFAKSIRKKPVACRCTKKKNPDRRCYDKAIYGQYLSPQRRGNFCINMD